MMNIFPPPHVLFLEKTPNPLYVETTESNRVAMAAFWRTFIMMEKLAPAGEGGGACPFAHTFSL
jgi:hypothetical protein